MNKLDMFARLYGTDKRTNDFGQNIYHGYVNIYYEYLKDKQSEYKNVLEIGVREGWSHLMWRDFFPNAMIYGIDNFSDEVTRDVSCDNIIIIKGDQSDQELIDKEFAKNRHVEFDTIIDDGSHFSWDQQKSFYYLWKYLKPGGYYFMEDMGVCQNRHFREFDDWKSSTVVWADSLLSPKPFSFYIPENYLKEIVSQIKTIKLIEELLIFEKVA